MKINQPMSADAAEAGVGSFEPWPAGEYDFTVAEATEGRSKAGHEMIALVLHVFNRTGARRVVFDYLSSSEKAQWKVRHFAEAMHLVRQYDAGELNPDEMLGKPGRCMLRIEEPDGPYAAKNTIGDYVVPKGSAKTAPKAKAPGGGGDNNNLDDEIPFAPCWQ